jgi:hypothetical protein
MSAGGSLTKKYGITKIIKRVSDSARMVFESQNLVAWSHDHYSLHRRRPSLLRGFNNTKGRDLKQDQKLWRGPITIGMDLGAKRADTAF